MGVSDPRDRPSQSPIDTFINEVATRSGGTIAIEPVYDAGVDTPEGFEVGVAGMVERGEVDLALVASRAWDLAGVTSFQPLQAPFLITDDALAAAVAAGDIGHRAMDGLAAVGVTGLALWPEDLRHPFSFVRGEPLLTPEDFAGDAVLFQPSAVTAALVAALGGTRFPDDMDRGEAVNQGLLQGSESGLLQGASLPGTPTATGNVTFFPKFQVLVGNAGALAGLTDEQRSILVSAASETQRAAIENHPTETDAAAGWCDAGGAIVLSDTDQQASFEAAAQPVFDQIQKDPTAAALISSIRELKANLIPAPGATACGTAVEPSGAPTLAPSARTITNSTFKVPFVFDLPSDWHVVVARPTYWAVNRPLVGDPDWPQIGIDMTIAEGMAKNPCQPRLGSAAHVGPSARDLADWMLSLEVLGATESTATQVAGHEALVIEDQFAGTGACPELQLWDNDGGFVESREHKRYYIFEVDGQRVVGVVMAPDADFERLVGEALAALDTVRFETE
jgi:TRAP-type C4-dicarboxylate transport system substrate-binding protein